MILTNHNKLHLDQLGSLEKAELVFERMMQESSAYRQKIDQLFGPDFDFKKIDWEQLPLLSKKDFYGIHEWNELLSLKSIKDIYSIYRSSGTTQSSFGNKGFFWPQSRSEDQKDLLEMQSKLIETFKLKERRTLVVIGLSLGSWAGGEQISFLFKTLALVQDIHLVVFSPGDQHSEIIEILVRQAHEFDQILIAFCTSAVYYLHKLAEQTGVELPLNKITYVVTGECFPEQLRLDLKKKAGQPMSHLTMISIYGSADTGFIGFESLPLIRLRQFLTNHPELAIQFGFNSNSVPNLFHVQVNDAFYESIEGELVMTKWRGMPLVRYNLQDRVRFYSWKTACLLCSEADSRSKSFWIAMSNLPMTDMISVAGRTSGCVFLCESIIYETMLQDVFLKSSISSQSTGMFVVWTENNKGQQLLCWQIELKAEIARPNEEEIEVIYREFVKLMCQQLSVFKNDYENLYQRFEDDGLRVFKFFFSTVPHLSEHPYLTTGFKRKMIVEKGPI